MALETRVMREGVLRWVQASGTAGWATASAPASGTFGYVQAGFTFSTEYDYETIMDRGVPKHHKLKSYKPPEIDIKVLYGITADYPAMITASGVSTPQIHLEFKAHDTESAGKDVPFVGTGLYFQLMNCVALTRGKFAEAENGDALDFKYRGLTASTWTGSGYLG
jgi:hypothetical protein